METELQLAFHEHLFVYQNASNFELKVNFPRSWRFLKNCVVRIGKVIRFATKWSIYLSCKLHTVPFVLIDLLFNSFGTSFVEEGEEKEQERPNAYIVWLSSAQKKIQQEANTSSSKKRKWSKKDLIGKTLK